MSELNPWKTVSSKLIYENQWIRVREDQVVRPDGQPGIYGVVSARPATGVVTLDDRGRTTLVGQYRYPLDRYSWEIPEGGADPGESPLDAARRELREEAGLTAERWDPLGPPVHLSNCFSSETGSLFLARSLTPAPASPDGTEQLRIATVPFAEALARVDSGEISDAMSVIGILRAARRLGLG